MFGLSWESFLRASIAGFAATFVMEMTGFWQSGLHIARVDGAQLLANSSRRHWVYGEFAHYMNGIALGIAYARWFDKFVPGPSLFKGLLWGLVTTIAADAVVVPLADPKLGPLFTKTPRPSRLQTGSLIVHLVYGLVLALGYEPPKEHRQ